MSRGLLSIGHRGAAGLAPENTLRSIETAIELGVDLVEVDVRRAGDGHLILIHDESVDRTTKGKGVVAQMTLSELRRFDAGQGERIPTLAEALHLANGRTGLILEIKVHGVAAQICEEVRRSGFVGQVIYASFDISDILVMKQVDPRAVTMQVFDRPPKQAVTVAQNARASLVGLRHDTVARSLVDGFHEAGLSVYVYTVNAPSDLQRISACGVDGIISDYPDRISPMSADLNAAKTD